MFKLDSPLELINRPTKRDNTAQFMTTELGVGTTRAKHGRNDAVDVSRPTVECIEADLEKNYPTTTNGMIAFLFLTTLSTLLAGAIVFFIAKSLQLI